MNKVTGIILLTCLLLTLAVAVRATSQVYDLTWWTVDSGGGVSQNGSYSLNATIGQADAGTLRGDRYSLAGGFWSAEPSEPIVIKYLVLLPLVVK